MNTITVHINVDNNRFSEPKQVKFNRLLNTNNRPNNANNRSNNVHNNHKHNCNNDFCNNKVKKKPYYFTKCNYKYTYQKINTDLCVIYKIKYNNNTSDIKLPYCLYSIKNDNYIYYKLLNIINSTTNLFELNYQWNVYSKLVNDTCLTSNVNTFINSIENLKRNL